MSVPAVWSTLLCSSSLATASAWTTMYTVPSGKRLILKEVCLQNLSGVAAVAGIGDGATHGIYQSPSVAAGTVLTIALWEVFNDGDTLKMIITAQPWTIRASGQLLDAP